MRENEFGAALGRVLRRQGALIYPNVASQWSPDGWPDIHVVHRMWTGLIEKKSATTKLQGIQLVMIREISMRRAREDIYVVVARHIKEDEMLVSTVLRGDNVLTDLFQCRFDEFLSIMESKPWCH